MYNLRLLDGNVIIIKDIPNTCPYCHKTILPVVLTGYKIDRELIVFLMCPDKSCNLGFTSKYNYNSNSQYQFVKVLQGTFSKVVFEKCINECSPMFEIIYNEAFQAEQNMLKEICGVGYRKALEYLIKDYLIQQYPEKSVGIKSMFLGKCISELIQNRNIKEISKRAVWLGNDETHYIKKWEDNDIEDLKKLIEITVHWINMELLSNQYISEMPEKV